jgi:4-amino-4-deoxy-L-arabinose transferase-like glycosyltransferase
MSSRFRSSLLITCLAAVLFIPFLQNVHLFDWDEINFAESAREMIETRDYTTVQIDYQLFWEKPPLFIWMQTMSMHLFGVNEMAARFPNAICGIITLLLLFRIGNQLYDNKFGWLWALSYAGSFLPFFYFKSGIIDPWFNLFIFIGIYGLYRYLQENRTRKQWLFLTLSAMSLGLAVLTKGPVAILISGLVVVVYILFNRFKISTKWTHVLFFIALLSIISCLWFFMLIAKGHANVINSFIVYQIRLFSTPDAGHGGFLLYHPVVLFLGVFPASIFALQAFRKSPTDTDIQRDFSRWMKILFWVVLILFTIVKTKIVHYSSLCYFPLTYLSAWTLYKILRKELKMSMFLRVLLIVLSLFWSVFVVSITQTDKFKSILINKGWIKDPFVVENLKAIVPWSGYECFTVILLLTGLIIFFILYKKNKLNAAIFTLFTSTALFAFVSIWQIVPKVEGYSQRAAIDFYTSIANRRKDCYLQTVGYKSYADLFYAKKPKSELSDMQHDWNWYSTGNIDKPVFFVIKSSDKNELLQKYLDWHYIYARNGFVFCIRYPKYIKE